MACRMARQRLYRSRIAYAHRSEPWAASGTPAVCEYRLPGRANPLHRCTNASCRAVAGVSVGAGACSRAPCLAAGRVLDDRVLRHACVIQATSTRGTPARAICCARCPMGRFLYAAGSSTGETLSTRLTAHESSVYSWAGWLALWRHNCSLRRTAEVDCST